MKAEYINHMGDDLTVVNAARVSFNKRSHLSRRCWSCDYCSQEWTDDSCPECGEDNYDPENLGYELDQKDAKLIKYLANHSHWTPFSHCQIQMRETVPIFVARQRFKHMIGFAYNEISRRYDDSPPEFYVPDRWRKRADNVKQGSSDEEITTIENIVWEMDIKEYYDMRMKDLVLMYDLMIKNGVAPEQARMVLPQSMYTSYYVTGSLAAWARAYTLRIEAHAQKEIQDLAKQWDTIIRPLFPQSWSALVDPKSDN